MSLDNVPETLRRRLPPLGTLEHSVAVYYGDPDRDAAMDRLYAAFLRHGDLAFDIGAHVGDRIAAFRRLGVRVVALEPQPSCVAVLKAIHGDDDGVTLIEAACGPQPGSLLLHVNSANPTVTTASPAFITAADGSSGWEGQVWDTTLQVPVTTLDALIARHGTPSFVKIDVEGFEHEVLAGLSLAVPALSFEFTTIQREVAVACLHRLVALGAYRFNLALGESQRLEQHEWLNVSGMEALLAGLPHSANSGDIYAVLT